ncbi:hypothetical protein SpCBS45565_g07899 [Spizellomyces sp. 'palustris']|nr:hypothetical protein SpCBS45565_g07899 [Spizellomyces sp. 'palustris']
MYSTFGTDNEASSPQQQAASMFNPRPEDRNSDADMEEWSARWRVVTSTKTRMWQAIGLHAGHVIGALSLAIAIGVNGMEQRNGETLCLLNMDFSTTGPKVSCALPITQSVFCTIAAIVIGAYNARSLIIYQSRKRTYMVAECVASLAMMALMFWAASSVSVSLKQTCEIFREHGWGSCSSGFAKYDKSLPGLTFGIVAGYFSAALWSYSTYKEWNAYRSKESL